jgi:hypothetical protein
MSPTPNHDDPAREGVHEPTGFDKFYGDHTPYDPNVDEVNSERPRTEEKHSGPLASSDDSVQGGQAAKNHGIAPEPVDGHGA